jgi:hypothetical protein
MSKFTIQIPCKTYVRRYFEFKFGVSDGEDIDLAKDKALYMLLRSKLKKKSFRHENVYKKFSFKRYSDQLNVSISQDDFYRYGWELSKTDVITLNQLFESMAKILMYTFISTHYALGISLSESIDLFQEKYGFTEDIWPKESIYKDCQRNLHMEKSYILKDVAELIDKINMAKLS